MNKLNYRKSLLLLKLIIALFFVSCSVNQSPRISLEFNGNIKSYFERIYKTKKESGNWQKGEIEDYGHFFKKFDKNGNFTTIHQLDKENKLLRKILSVQENGKIVEEITYDKEGKREGVIKINHINRNQTNSESFDVNGNKVNGTMFRKNGKRTKYIHMRNDELEHVSLWKYDKKGKLTSQKVTNKKGEIILNNKFEYLEFDLQNNWTRKLIYKDGDDYPQNIVIREIQYYQ
ncbi:hypothetical protein [uncultured Aquimarina sp.]|uniref:hypothetical protein n=1 Tax=uncultured Aquimarina sp. TaxID=575652 RepID=UPI00262AD54C|nr:hypothetical protein [uncultured Aquimarina sp.]